jgi:hypothetical protein
MHKNPVEVNIKYRKVDNMSELTLVNNSNFAAMAQAMGMGADIAVPKKQNNLARLKLDHKGIMGETTVNGKKKKVEVVAAGSYVLDRPNLEPVYSTDVSIRLFNQRFMYKRYIQGSGDSKGKYVKTIMAKDLKEDLRDNAGGFNCGKPGGWIEDYSSLPAETKTLLKSIKRVRVLFGEVTLKGAVNAKGEDLGTLESIPFIWEVDNKDAFKTLGAPIAQMAKQNRILPQHSITLGSDEQSLPTGASYFLPTATLELGSTIDLTDKDQVLFADFNAWIDNYNDYIVKEFNDNAKSQPDAELAEIVEEFVDVEVE